MRFETYLYGIVDVDGIMNKNIRAGSKGSDDTMS